MDVGKKLHIFVFVQYNLIITQIFGVHRNSVV